LFSIRKKIWVEKMTKSKERQKEERKIDYDHLSTTIYIGKDASR